MLKTNFRSSLRKIKRIGLHNILSAYSLFLVIKSTEFLKTFHKDSLNVMLGVPARIFAIDCLSRPMAGVPAVSSLIKQKSKIYDLSTPVNVTHPKHLDLITPKISGSANVVVIGPVFVDTHSGKLLVSNLFGPNTKTVEIYLGHTYNSYITSGVNYFLRKKIKNIKNGVYYSIQVREDQNYYHFLLLLAPAILRVFNFCLKNEIEVIFLVPKSAPKFLQDFLQTIPIKTQTISKKNAELENVILTTIYSGDSPHPLDIKSLNEHARQILKNESVSTSNFSNKKYISTKLIYVSRKNQSRYSKIDEKIEKILIKAGFFILRPEEFTLQQQVYFFNNSKLVIGNHGAGLANLVFCKKGTQVIELAVIEIQINDWMKNLSQILEIDYNYLEIKEESDLSELSNLVSMLKRKVDES